jgi:hypothetical protein
MQPTNLPSSAVRGRRLAVIVATALSGVLVFISMIVDPAPDGDGVAMVEAYAANLTASGLHTNLIHYGFALAAPAVFAIVGLVRGRGGWIANVAGLLAVLGFSTLPGLVLMDFASVAVLRSSGAEAVAAMDAEMAAFSWFTAVMVPGLISSLLAGPVAIAALCRAQLAPWWSLAALLICALAPMVAPVWWVGFGLNAVGALIMAWLVARIPLALWTGEAAARQPNLPTAAAPQQV